VLLKYGDGFVIICLSWRGVFSPKTKVIIPPLVDGLGVLSKHSSRYMKGVFAQEMPPSLHKGRRQLADMLNSPLNPLKADKLVYTKVGQHNLFILE